MRRVESSSGFVRYLSAKRTVDRRALHAGVLERAAEAVGALVGRQAASRPARALEVGGGAGGAFAVWMEVLTTCPWTRFVATDRCRDLLRAYREAVLHGAGDSGLEVLSSGADQLRLTGGGPSPRRVEVRFEAAALPMERPPGRFDLLLGQSVWDLLPPGSALGFAGSVLVPGGLFLATLTFDGATRFDPPHEFDGPILASYHRSMGGERGGDPAAGGRLARDFAAAGSGFRVLAEGPSDWCVAPDQDGYPADEQYFLETILGFVAKETARDPAVPVGVRRAWLDARRGQVADEALGYSASQRDLLAERIR